MSTRAPTPLDEPRLLRIQEVAAEVGLTARSIRYYEELGLLEPAARSDGDYRLFDASDLERLRFIKSLRDDAGFSLAQVGQMLEDEAARNATANDSRTRPTRRSAASTSMKPWPGRAADRLLDAKADRIAAMIDDAPAPRATHPRRPGRARSRRDAIAE